MSRLVTALFAACLLGLSQVPAHAQAIADDLAPTRAISVPKDKSVAFRLSPAAAEVVVAQPKIAQIVANNNNSIYVRGQDMGSTNILVYDKAHHLLEVVDVNVGFDASAAQAAINRELPNDHIIVTGLGTGLLLSGEVPNTHDAARAQTIAERYAPKQVTSELMIAASQQIMLEVRILEANRLAMKEFGISLDIAGSRAGLLTNAHVPVKTGPGLISGLYDKQTSYGRTGLSTNIGNTTIDLVLDVMEEKGLVRTLARPNLAAISGEEASFLAGGEFPYKVSTGLGTESVEFKPFGVQLKFTPVVEPNGQIRLKVAPEVSALDFNTGTNVPGLTVRRTSTTVELRDGETFAIAGLFQQEYLNNARQVPGLGDIPVLGALFKSTRWQRKETELVVLVTPMLVTSPESLGVAPDPLRVSNEPSAIDMILQAKDFDQPLKAPVEGPTGGLRGPLK
ncbi:MAG: type II and III secretion system protein family protein [Parcubacteria group bacterium]